MTWWRVQRRTQAIVTICVVVGAASGVAAWGDGGSPGTTCAAISASVTDGHVSLYPAESVTGHDASLDIIGYNISGADDGRGGGTATVELDVSGAPAPPPGYGGAFYEVGWTLSGTKANGQPINYFAGLFVTSPGVTTQAPTSPYQYTYLVGDANPSLPALGYTQDQSLSASSIKGVTATVMRSDQTQYYAITISFPYGTEAQPSMTLITTGAASWLTATDSSRRAIRADPRCPSSESISVAERSHDTICRYRRGGDQRSALLWRRRTDSRDSTAGIARARDSHPSERTAAQLRSGTGEPADLRRRRQRATPHHRDQQERWGPMRHGETGQPRPVRCEHLLSGRYGVSG